MPANLDPYRCPAEDAIEIWAIQDVLGVPDNDERLHLVNCPFCHELHTRFVDFYCTMTREAQEYLVANPGSSRNATPIQEIPVGSASRHLWPIDRFDETLVSNRPIAVSNHLLAGIEMIDNATHSFISTDGTIIGKIFRLNGNRDWSFQLVSAEPSFTERTIFRLNHERAYFQSNEKGSSLLSMGDHTPDEIESIELIPFFTETLFDPAAGANDPGLVPDTVRVDAGPAGEIIMEQEEGDHGEAVLHLILTGMPKAYFTKRIIVALDTGYSPPLAEEAVGRELYYYGVDLFRPFRIWVYLLGSTAA